MIYYVYDLYSYDTVGNKKEGFEVNDIWCSEKDIYISKDDLSTNKKLIKALKKLGILETVLHIKSIGIEGEAEHTLYFSDLRNNSFKPEFELRFKKKEDIT